MALETNKPRKNVCSVLPGLSLLYGNVLANGTGNGGDDAGVEWRGEDFIYCGVFY